MASSVTDQLDAVEAAYLDLLRLAKHLNAKGYHNAKFDMHDAALAMMPGLREDTAKLQKEARDTWELLESQTDRAMKLEAEFKEVAAQSERFRQGCVEAQRERGELKEQLASADDAVTDEIEERGRMIASVRRLGEVLVNGGPAAYVEAVVAAAEAAAAERESRIAELEQQLKMRHLEALCKGTFLMLSEERVKVLEAALRPICELLRVDYNTGRIHLEIAGTPAFRPIDPQMRDHLGTLFTHLRNARAALATPSSDEANWPHVAAVPKDVQGEAHMPVREERG